MSFYPNTARNNNQSDDEEGQVRSSDSEQDEIEEGQLDQPEENQRDQDQIYQSASSEEDKDRIEQEMKKREDFYKTINQSKPDAPENVVNTFESALQVASKTNKKMLMLRKKVKNNL